MIESRDDLTFNSASLEDLSEQELIGLIYRYLQEDPRKLQDLRRLLGDPAERVKVESRDDLKLACGSLDL